MKHTTQWWFLITGGTIMIAGMILIVFAPMMVESHKLKILPKNWVRTISNPISIGWILLGIGIFVLISGANMRD